MKKAKSENCGMTVPTSQRITRSRSAAVHASGPLLPLEPSLKRPDKRLTRASSKRAASDEDSLTTTLGSTFQQKKRDVLKDISNIFCNNSYNCAKATRQQSKASSRVKPGLRKGNSHSDIKDSKLAFSASVGSSSDKDEAHHKPAEDIPQVPVLLESQESVIPEKISFALQNLEGVRDGESMHATTFLRKHCSRGEELIDHPENAKDIHIQGSGGSASLDYVDIDAGHSDPQFCSLYAPVVYTNIRASELIRRPDPNFMETVQRDITPVMRTILIDWLVEVADEHRLVPDTLYLTVHYVDRFLSGNVIEKQRLQLLGITCMLIASKYEEICAPRVQELCFITDNTYSESEVLKMERQVLNYLGFWLSVPTTKTFLRRFLQASEASLKVIALPLGCLANYLAELTLLDYSFLKFLPSLIAASAVFLARWTFNQTCHPWDQTLQHYTSYRASDLEETVIALQDLQVNSKSSPLSAIQDKYKQQKFKYVATLTSPKLLPSLFC